MSDKGRVVTLIQARTGSGRLPGKMLLPLAGSPALVRMVERVGRARLAGTIVVATTWLAEDDPIGALCTDHGIACFRGHPTDLLDRHVRAAAHFSAEHVVKIPSDCPLIDPAAIDRVLAFHLERPGVFDYVGNLHPPTWPDGNDVEIMTFGALRIAWQEATRPHEREHTTPFLWDRPERFRIGNVRWETGLDLSATHRFTLDYPEDYELIRGVYEAIYPSNPSFDLGQILDLAARQPSLLAINGRYAGVNWYRHHLAELRTVSAGQTRQPEDDPAERAAAGGRP